jgi:hypothetical protein
VWPPRAGLTGRASRDVAGGGARGDFRIRAGELETRGQFGQGSGKEALGRSPTSSARGGGILPRHRLPHLGCLFPLDCLPIVVGTTDKCRAPVLAVFSFWKAYTVLSLW